MQLWLYDVGLSKYAHVVQGKIEIELETVFVGFVPRH